jgi:hypothetical protein
LSKAELDFFEELMKDDVVATRLTRKELLTCFDLEQKLRFIDDIFKKAFGL